MRESIAEKKRERKEITNKLPWPPPPMPPWKEYFMKLNHTNDEIFCVNIILIIHLMKRTNTRSLSHQIIQRIITKSINLLFSSVERYQGMYPTTQSIHEGWCILWRYYHNYLYDESYNRTILLPSKYSIKNNNKYDRSLFSLHREISKNASYCIIDNAYITDSETNNSYLIIKHPNTVNVPSFCSLMIYMFLATSYLILSHIIFIATIISHVVLFKSQLLR